MYEIGITQLALELYFVMTNVTSQWLRYCLVSANVFNCLFFRDIQFIVRPRLVACDYHVNFLPFLTVGCDYYVNFLSFLTVGCDYHVHFLSF